MDEAKIRTVTVKVFAPRDKDPKTFTWRVTLIVRDAARDAANAFGISGGDPTLGRGDDVFKRDEPLEHYHVHDHESLELLDVGGGV